MMVLHDDNIKEFNEFKALNREKLGTLFVKVCDKDGYGTTTFDRVALMAFCLLGEKVVEMGKEVKV